MTTALIQETKKEVFLKALKPQNRDKVQVLRGIASLAVICHHLELSGFLDPNFKIYLGIATHGGLRPLLFFMLSGYLVNLDNKISLSNWKEVKLFIKKKIYRLYPVYSLVVLFTFFISYDEQLISKLITHLLFFQNISSSLFGENHSLWTMNFEVLFYVCFLCISYFRIERFYVPTGAALIGFALLYMQVNVPMLISFCFGLTFWGVGFVYGGCKLKRNEYPTSYLIAVILLIFCYQQIEVSEYFFNILHINFFPQYSDFWHYPVKFRSLSYIPVCLLIVSFFNSRMLKFHRYALFLVYVPVFIRIVLLASRKDITADLYFPISLFLTSTVCLFLRFKLNLSVLNRFLIFLGGISYSLYLIHYPVIFLFKRFTPISGSLYTAIFRLLFYLILVIFISYILEKRYQRYIVEFIESKKYTINEYRALLWDILHRPAK